MLINEKRKMLFRERIKRVFFENFRREISVQETDEILDKMLSNTMNQLSKIPDIQEKDYEKYFSTDRIEIVFSPLQINSEVVKIIEKIGIDTLEQSKDYKRLGEMTDAATLALVLKKSTGEEWCIKGQDNPDILLVRPNGKIFKDDPFHAINLEIMQITPHVKDKMNHENIEAEVARFIKEKKFLKRYGPYSHLLVHINFDHKGFRMEELSKELTALDGNPFHQVWVRATTDPSYTKMSLVRISPDFLNVVFDSSSKEDMELYY